jgi:hypothetical protein
MNLECRSVVQGGKGISGIFKRGIGFIQLLFTEHSEHFILTMFVIY